MDDGDITLDFELFKTQLMSAVAAVANNELADAVKEKLVEAVETNVYLVYQPIKYTRRGENGGLADTDNYQHIVRADKDEVVLTVKNETTGAAERSIYINDVIETGKGYWKGVNIGPRPFMNDGLNEGIEDGTYENVLAAGLSRFGYDIAGGFGFGRG